MAILIPSKNIYNKQNPKIRDNLIDRIEVGSVEVVRNNEYEITVYNEDILLHQNQYEVDTNSTKEKLDYHFVNDPYAPSVLHLYRAYAFLDSTGEYVKGSIEIPKVKNNKYISTLNYGTDKWNIQSSLVLSTTTSLISGDVNIIGYDTIGQKSISYGSEVTSYEYAFPNMPSTITSTLGGATVTLTGVENKTVLDYSYEELEDSYVVSYKVLKRLSEERYSGSSMELNSEGTDITIKGEKIEYNAERIEITVYGNTISIDLNEKTAYIPETDQTSKKVHAIDGNELMQTTNYSKTPLVEGIDYTTEFFSNNVPSSDRGLIIRILDNSVKARHKIDYRLGGKQYSVEIAEGVYSYFIRSTQLILVTLIERLENSINKEFMATRSEYSRGKETATIRCSISDYYTYDTKKPNNQGNKAISVDYSNPPRKMYFAISDIVVPMVYGADGKDKPMSETEDGVAKQFVVRGIKLFFDGAVWQELYLQEY